MNSNFIKGFEKRASFAHAAELIGLGVLAAPAAHELKNEEGAKQFWTPKKKAVAEVAGLGILGVPSAIHFAKKLKNFARR
jgi:3-hydroxyisobutyrate dehydrogenase-like beta-hydroxyacid dehydrogenase